MFYVYEHWRPDTNRPFYVGKGSARRATTFDSRRSAHHKNIVAKVGRENVIIKIVANNLPEQAALDIEMERIALWTEMGVKLANKTSGGEAGKTMSAEYRGKLSKAKTGRKRKPFSAETRARMSAARKGMKFSEEHKAKISQNWVNPWPTRRTK